jgi:hypothetical protein
MARFTTAGGSGEGTVGPTGPTGPEGPAGADGADGADALWNFLGEWENGIDYAAGSVVEFQGSSYYHPTGQFSSYSPPTNGWLLVSSKGDTGENGANGADGEDAEAVSETSFTVNGGTTGTQPTFDGAPLFSGSYVKTGPMVHFQIQVDMDNITSFGTGQYYVDLPFDAKYGYQFKAGCLHDISTGRQYALGGHVYAGQSQLLLSYTDSNGQDADFDYNSPTTLSTADNFHISGTYIIEE